MDRTTDLNELRNRKPFTWGEIVTIHEIAAYAIVEYHPFIYKNNCGTGEIDYKAIEFHSYVDGKGTACSAESLDSALAYCIAYKYEGANTRASAYFMKMIKSNNQG